jgi:hypothetical protein
MLGGGRDIGQRTRNTGGGKYTKLKKDKELDHRGSQGMV